ncbi:MAG: peptidase M15 [bacterium]|nr:peptidase M15 [bacterium]
MDSFHGFLNNPYFTAKEFDSPDKVLSGRKMNVEFINKLTYARNISDTPYVISSGFRTRSHNKSLKAKKNSSHLKYLACDIICNDSKQRHNILGGLLLVGFTRIGISKGFIHVDMDPNKPQEVIWIYD